MTYFALINESNYVTQVIVGRDSDKDLEGLFAAQFNCKCKKAARDGSIRGTYPGPGYFYDEVGDFFIEAPPYPSWQLNRTQRIWEPPVPHPNPQHRHAYFWDEDQLNWVLHSSPFPSWQLDPSTYQWEPPVAMPNDGDLYHWDETALNWFPVDTIPFSANTTSGSSLSSL